MKYMEYKDINRRFTEVVASYIEKGYIINTSSMTGSQNDITHIDLRNGESVIRVLLNRTSNIDNTRLAGIELIVGLAPGHSCPVNTELDIIWNDKLFRLSKENFYLIGEGRLGRLYGTEAEAKAAQTVRNQRGREKFGNSDYYKDITKMALPIAKEYLRRVRHLERIRTGDVAVIRSNNKYIVMYRGNPYTLR